MGSCKQFLSVVTVALVAGVASPALAQQNERPNATFLLGGDLFQSGQSDNLGSVARQVLSDYWTRGDCPDSFGSYRHCDDLRYGLTLYPKASCGSNHPNCNAFDEVVVEPHEDGGGEVEDALQNIQNKSGAWFRDEPSFRPADDSMLEHQAHTFDGTQSAADSPWARPNLNLMVFADMPQTSDVAQDDRVKKTILNACRLLEGRDASGANGAWPSMPTWAMVARQHGDTAYTFTGLVSAAGGTGSCCFDQNGNCDPVADAIDVCADVQGKNEQILRNDIANGKYVCGAGDGFVQVGAMGFAGNDVRKQIACHLAGRYNSGGWHHDDDGDCGRGVERTDVLGIMSCVRKLPDGIDPDQATFTFCPDWATPEWLANHDYDPCTELSVCDENSPPDCEGIEWVDPNRSLYVISGRDYCDKTNSGDGTIDVTQCPNEGNSCTVDERVNGSPAYGRCSVGQIYCDAQGNEHCGQLYNPMPEICNGLDDDCNGQIDNLSTSWDNPDFRSYDPTELGSYDSDGVNRTAIHCYERDVCTCNGADNLDYGGPGYEAHVMSWEPGACVCGAGLGEQSGPDYTPAAPTSQPAGEPKAGCSATPSRTPAGGWAAVALGFLGALGAAYGRRRR